MPLTEPPRGLSSRQLSLLGQGVFALIPSPFLEGGAGAVVESARPLGPRTERGMSPKHALGWLARRAQFTFYC